MIYANNDVMMSDYSAGGACLVAEELEVVVVNSYHQNHEQQKKQKKIQHAVSFLSYVIDARHGV